MCKLKFKILTKSIIIPYTNPQRFQRDALKFNIEFVECNCYTEYNV